MQKKLEKNCLFLMFGTIFSVFSLYPIAFPLTFSLFNESIPSIGNSIIVYVCTLSMYYEDDNC